MVDGRGNGSTIGRQLRLIRRSRGLSQQVIADLAGISKGHLSRLESGQRALDRRSLIIALANALQISPTELTEVALPDLADDSGIGAQIDQVRVALLAVGMSAPAGAPQPAEVLRGRVARLLDDQQSCRHEQVAAALPDVIGDLHATIAAGTDGPALAELAILLHVQGTQAWLRDVGGPLDLGWQAATLAQQQAQRIDDARLLGLAAFGTGHGLLAAGAFDLAEHRLHTATSAISTVDVGGMQLAGMLLFTSSLLAAARRDPSEAAAALDAAAELAARTGEANAFWFGFGPTNVGVWRMAVALEAGDHAAAAATAESLDPALIPSPQRRAAYWADYGRALARLRGRTGQAVRALRHAANVDADALAILATAADMRIEGAVPRRYRRRQRAGDAMIKKAASTARQTQRWMPRFWGSPCGGCVMQQTGETPDRNDWPRTRRRAGRRRPGPRERRRRGSRPGPCRTARCPGS